MRKLTLVSVLAASLALSACGSDSSETSGSFDGEDGLEGNYSIDDGDGNASVDVSDDEGNSVSYKAGDDLDADDVELAFGFSAYPGAKLLSNADISTSDGSGNVMGFTTGDSAEEVIAFYKKQAESAGITIAADVKTSGMHIVSGESDDGASFAITVAEVEGATNGNLMVGKDL